eukprot:1208201-Rhodomonas_salina.1
MGVRTVFLCPHCQWQPETVRGALLVPGPGPVSVSLSQSLSHSPGVRVRQTFSARWTPGRCPPESRCDSRRHGDRDTGSRRRVTACRTAVGVGTAPARGPHRVRAGPARARGSEPESQPEAATIVLGLAGRGPGRKSAGPRGGLGPGPGPCRGPASLRLTVRLLSHRDRDWHSLAAAAPRRAAFKLLLLLVLVLRLLVVVAASSLRRDPGPDRDSE